MDGEEDVSTTLYIDDSIELILLLVMFGTALWVDIQNYILQAFVLECLYFLSRCTVAFINLRSILVQFHYLMTCSL